jgi:hypothetical protein
MKNITKFAVVGMLTVMPLISFGAVRTLKDLIDLVIDYLGYAIPLIMSLSIVVFIWGVYKYFIKVDADRAEAGNYILYGVIGFFLMLSFWGVVNILIQTLNLDNNIRGIPFIGSDGGSRGGTFYEVGRPSGSTFYEVSNPGNGMSAEEAYGIPPTEGDWTDNYNN